MSPQRVQALLSALFARHAPLSVREGSVIADQIVAPASLLGAPLYSLVEDLVEQNSLPRQGSNSALLDAIGERLLSPRVSGSRSAGTIRVALDAPQRTVLRTGYPVYTVEGVGFRVSQTVTIPANSFTLSTRWGQQVYLSPPVDVEAMQTGPRGMVQAEALSVPGFAVAGLVGVYNEAETTSAVEPENDASFEERLRHVISTRSFDTPAGLLFGLPAQMGGDIEHLDIIGTNSPFLHRAVLPVRRVIDGQQVEVSITLDRTSSATTGIVVDVNTKTMTLGAATSNWVLVDYDQVGDAISGSVYSTLSSIKTALKAAPYGHYLTLYIGKGASIDQELQDLMDLHLGAVRYPNRTSSTDYVLFGRKGDATFVTREYLESPANGDVVLSFSSFTSLETGAFGTVGYINKTKGFSRPNANRLLTRPSLVKLKEVDEFAKEVSQEDYNLLARPDLRTLHVGTSVLFKDTFDRTAEDGGDVEFTTALGKGWIAGNTGERKVVQETAAGVYLHADRLILAPTRYNAADVDAALTGVMSSTSGLRLKTGLPALAVGHVEQVRSILSQSLSAGQLSDVMSKVEDAVEAVAPQDTVEGYKGEAGATSPVVQRKLEDPYGFRMKGTLRTTDTEGNPCAITMARTAPGPGEKFRWYEGYGVSVSVSHDNLLPNVFVVDGASTDREMVVVGDELVNGRLNHNTLAQTRVDIQPGITYHYELTFGSPSGSDPEDAVTLDFRIWAEGANRPVTATLSYGAYVPMARRQQRLQTTYTAGEDVIVEEAQDLQANHVGIGVSNTKGSYLWAFKDFSIENVDSDYAQAIAELDVRGMDESIEMQVVARGRGYDPTSSGVKYGYDVHVWNPSTTTWDEVAASSTTGHDHTSVRFGIQNSVYAPKGVLTLLISSLYAHEGAALNAVESTLDLDFVYGQDASKVTVQGGKADILFMQTPAESGADSYRPSSLRSRQIVSAPAVSVITPDQLGGALEEVTRVYVGSGQSAVDLTPGEYRLYWEDASLRGTVRERLILALDPGVQGLNVTVEARVHDRVLSLQSLLDNSDLRKYDGDILARHRQSLLVDVSGSVTESWSSSQKDELRGYIYGAETLSRSEVANVLISLGAGEVTLTGPGALVVTVRRLTTDGDWDKTILTDTSVITTSPLERLIPGDTDIAIS